MIPAHALWSFITRQDARIAAEHAAQEAARPGHLSSSQEVAQRIAAAGSLVGQRMVVHELVREFFPQSDNPHSVGSTTLQ